MPPKKAPKLKKPRLGRAGRAPRSAPDKKKSQKLKQIQKVNVNVTSGGGGGGSSAPPSFIPQPFRDTSGENVQLINLVKSVSDNLARGNVLGRAPVPVFVAPEVAPNPTNDASTTTAVFNAPNNNTDNLADEVLREINQLGIKPKPVAKPPPIFNAPNENNTSLMDRIRKVEKGYEENPIFNTPIRPRAESAPPDFLSMGAGYVGTPVEPYITRTGKWRSDISRADLERLAQDYNIATTGQDETGKSFKLNKEQIKSILNVRLGL
jgi:hypothetical protein